MNGVDYVAVNDSFADSNEDAKRLYRLEQFSEAWHSRVAYIIGGNYHGYERLMQPSRESVKLVANDERTAFTLRQDGETVAITPKMVEQADPFDQQTVTIAYTVNDGGQFDTTAQQHFDYADADEEGRIKLDLAAIKQAIS